MLLVVVPCPTPALETGADPSLLAEQVPAEVEAAAEPAEVEAAAEPAEAEAAAEPAEAEEPAEVEAELEPEADEPEADEPAEEPAEVEAEEEPEAIVEAEEEPEAEEADAVMAVRQGDIPTAKLKLPHGLDEDEPTQRIPHKPPRERTAEDERLVAAVLPLAREGEPGPLDDFLGRSLLFRAAHAAREAGAPRLLLVGVPRDGEREALLAEARRGFAGEVELVGGDPDAELLADRGRVLLLDSSALHDPESIRRLAQVKGERTSLLLVPYGDGLCVRTDGGRVVSMGRNLDPSDGRLAGAASAPLEHFERLMRVGERAALEGLVAEDQLVTTVAPRSFGQQLQDKNTYRHAREHFFDHLASSGSDGVFDMTFGRPLSRRLTLGMLHKPAITPDRVSLLAGLAALLGAGAVAFGGAWGALGGSLLLVLSSVLDRVDGELARLRLERQERMLDFGLDHLTHMLVFMGLAWAVSHAGGVELLRETIPPLADFLAEQRISALLLGFVASAGVLMLGGVLLMRGPVDGEPQPLLTRAGDFIASSFGSRDYFWLLFLVAALNAALGLPGLLALFLVVTTALVHVTWVLLLLINLVAPRRSA